MSCGSNINIPEKTIPITDEQRLNNRLYIMKWLVEKSGISGITPERAAGFCGNMHAESQYNPNAVNPGSKAYGLCQWLGKRKTNLKNFATQNQKQVDDIDLQLAFLVHEIKGSYYNTSCWKEVLNADNTVDDATKIILRHYEVPGRTKEEADAKTERDAPTRIGYGKQALKAYNEKK